MKLVKGKDLTAKQRREVLACFVHRWTHENARQTYSGACPGCEQSKPFPTEHGQTREQWHAYHVPLVSDEQWLADHAFYVKANGELSDRHDHCEPAYMAEREVV